MTHAYTEEVDVDRHVGPGVELGRGPQPPTWSDIDDRGQQGVPGGIYYIGELAPEMPTLRAPLKVQLSISDDGLLEADAPALGLSGVGSNVEDAVRDLASTISGLWDEFTHTPPEQLHSSALDVLARLRRFLVDPR